MAFARESATALLVVVGFVAVLFAGSRWLPGRRVRGPVLSDGRREEYRLNGATLFALCAAAAVLCLALAPGIVAYPARHAPALLVAANAVSAVAAAALYVEGRRGTVGHGHDTAGRGHDTAGRRPRHPAADFFYGVRLNPRLFGVDLKMFAYRPSLIGLFLVNVSWAAVQLIEHGAISERMAAYQVLFFLYIANYFQFEHGMMYTWDVMAERFGLMLVWGDLVLVPFFYGLPGPALVDMARPLTAGEAALSLTLFCLGFWMFRGANEQKHRFKAGGEVRIWGRPARSLDGRLLISGFWGIGRKLNYTGELLVYLSWTLLCGTESLLPYAVVLWLLLLFAHRAHRDDKRCRAKYGELWERYCRTARFRMLPFIY
ncbi:DUF1295 domain-containing protein [Streptomyces sp. URMC 123]|uniref:DUF1295 domain-containing protein n=1 Tax=Streptomyces sp. URMC 123 TaxID=3423403 RepID=UPI003F1B5BE6